jgi:hypothetical protein
LHRFEQDSPELRCRLGDYDRRRKLKFREKTTTLFIRALGDVDTPEEKIEDDEIDPDVSTGARASEPGSLLK